MHLVGRHNAGHSGKNSDSNGNISRSGPEETAFMVSFHDVLMLVSLFNLIIIILGSTKLKIVFMFTACLPIVA